MQNGPKEPSIKFKEILGYWGRVFARAATDWFHLLFPHWVLVMVELASIPLAAWLLSKVGYGPLGADHVRWEIAVLIAAAILYAPIFLWKLFITPAVMEREQKQAAENREKEHTTREAQLLTQIEKKPPTTSADEFEEISKTFGALETWAQQLLELLYEVKVMNANFEWSYLRDKGIEAPQHDSLGKLNKMTGGWLVYANSGQYSIRPNIRAHLRKLFEG
jgi:hypothetical protein